MHCLIPIKNLMYRILTVLSKLCIFSILIPSNIFCYFKSKKNFKRSLCCQNYTRKLTLLTLSFGITFCIIYTYKKNNYMLNSIFNRTWSQNIIFSGNWTPNTLFNGNWIQNNCNYGKNGQRILCAVFTYEQNYPTKATAVNNTWGIFLLATKNSQTFSL